MRLALLLVLVATAAHAKIPDFGVATAPDIIKNDPNPKAREFYRELVEHAKKEARQMVRDTQKTTGLKWGDLKKVDIDCLVWRVAASTAKNLRRRFPGLQPPEFADIMETTALDEDDCPDEGGPGSRGVQIYNAAINQVQAGRDGWQRTELPADSNLFRFAQAMMAAGATLGKAAPVTAAPAGVVPLILINPELFMPKDESDHRL